MNDEQGVNVKHVLLSLALSIALVACGATPAPPAPPSISAREAADIDTLIETTMAERGIPKAVAMVANGDTVLYQGTFGRQRVADDIEIGLDAIFNLASMTKPVTSVAVMMLAEEGAFALDDPVSRYLPAMAARVVVTSMDTAARTYETTPAATEITIRQLLSHTSGLAYDFSNQTMRTLMDITGKQPLELPLVDQPGTKWNYSGSTAVLGNLVAEVSGMPLDVFLQSRIFEPLGMVDTSYVVPADKRARVVTIHTLVDGTLVEGPVPETVESGVRGDGGLYGTAPDYIRFLQMLLNKGELDGVRLLSEASVDAMTSNQIGAIRVQTQGTTNAARSADFPIGAGEDTFGLGFQITAPGGANPDLRAPGSYSWAGIFNTHFWGDPQRGMVAVILMQQLPFYSAEAMALYQDFEEAVNRSLAQADE
jgi:CubicO group peptidase (beta-lactamase class C family)